MGAEEAEEEEEEEEEGSGLQKAGEDEDNTLRGEADEAVLDGTLGLVMARGLEEATEVLAEETEEEEEEVKGATEAKGGIDEAVGLRAATLKALEEGELWGLLVSNAGSSGCCSRYSRSCCCISCC